MNEDMCKIFEMMWEDFPDTLGNDGNYQFKNEDIYSKYCDSNCDNCRTDLDKINAACFVLFKIFFEDSESFMKNAKCNMNIAQYIIIWLSYILSLKENNNISNLKDFYDLYINSNDKYNDKITGVKDYTSYKDLIDKNNYFLSMNMKIVSKFYTSFKSLCSMYNEIEGNKSNSTKCLEEAKNFVDEYEKHNENYDINKDSLYSQILSTLLTDYNNFKSYFVEKCSHCRDISAFPVIKTTSSLSIASKLIPVLLMFAIPIFLGIAYKYSLFGFDKRVQRQTLRKKYK
ncbi:CIR protein [Plasmodium chabaudi chabaudi]|uniref:CIR protein n=1 Tax=Plasmodium chabaudi chabaudi TaxID=31271 RepID=A0A4V0K7Y9_PLACU|nr:CIR protein [Plasmodium chabaudi chabaudi]VTZ68603.1 CIR protein [Plasmodium chabaudi chabaudi]|eukprot:XP_016652880.1 CIR protein [Plasmodium chabaudi chabaudi]